VAGDAPDPWEDDHLAGDVLEGGMRPSWSRRRWAALRPGTRRLVVGLLVLIAVTAAGLEVRDRAEERERAQRVDLTASIGVSSLSTTPPGGQVSFFVVVRNRGASPVWITAVAGSADGLRVRTSDDAERLVSPQGESAVPVSVRLTCARYGPGALDVDIAVRRADRESVTRRVRPAPADALFDVASTLCEVRPDLRDRELSGPVLAALSAVDPDR
jgi:hypothetical protein